MKAKKNKPKIGRDPTKGLVSFKTGTHKSRKNREANRKDKYAKRNKNKDLQE